MTLCLNIQPVNDPKISTIQNNLQNVFKRLHALIRRKRELLFPLFPLPPSPNQHSGLCHVIVNSSIKIAFYEDQHLNTNVGERISKIMSRKLF